MSVPAGNLILTTSRFRCREMTESDADFLAAMLGDAEVMRHYPKPLDRAESDAWLQRVLAAYARAGHAFWMVERLADGARVGQIGLLPKEIDGRPEVEVAYMVHRPFWRQGIALEVAMACRDYAFTTLRAPRVVCMIRQENLPSLAVAAKLGMRRIGDIVYFGLPHWLFEYRHNAVASP
jgi:RimJ/RimL family protein N-acetyltransferase